MSKTAPDAHCIHAERRVYVVYCVFSCFILIQMFVNYDAGAIPSVLTTLEKKFSMTSSISGLLGALPYFGVIVATLFVGWALQRWSPKRLLMVSVLLNSASVFFLALSQNIAMLFTSRFLIGASQSVFCIYAPVWIDEFAPPKYCSSWMGLLQGSTALGVVIGYLVTGYSKVWWHSLMGQGAALLVLWLAVVCTPVTYIDVCAARKLASLSSGIVHHNRMLASQTHSAKADAAGVFDAFVEPRSSKDADDVTPPRPVGDIVSCDLNSQGTEQDLQSMSLPLSLELSKIGNSTALVPHQKDTEERDAAMEPALDAVSCKFYSEKTGNQLSVTSGKKGSASAVQLPLKHLGVESSDCKSHRSVLEKSKTKSEKPYQTHFLNHAPSLLVPSPAGAVLETLEISGQSGFSFLRKQQPGEAIVASNTQNLPDRSSGLLRSMSLRSMSVFHQLKLLLGLRVYCWTVVTLCGLLFVITGIQFWGTTYFTKGRHIERRYVLLCVSAVAATGPATGVLFGAVTVDRLGGYRTKEGLRRTLWFCFISGCFASALSIIVSFLDNFPATVALMWFVFFFGGSVLPSATGILIASADPSLRPFASSFSIFVYNIFGYALGSFLPGPFINWLGYIHGMKIVFFWSIVGVCGMSMALWSNIHEAKHSKHQLEDVT